jgi:hypothetical protein
MYGSPFRDELACAHEKIQQLETENHVLRSQLGRVPPRARPSILVPLTAAWAILMTATVVRVSGQAPPMRGASAPVTRMPPSPRESPDCSPPPPSPGPFHDPALGI